jgi:hypothetical protein
MKSALLECELSKRPQNVVWKDKNGQIIEDSDKYEIMNNGKLQGKKRISNYSLSRREESYKHKLSDCLLVCPHLTD